MATINQNTYDKFIMLNDKPYNKSFPYQSELAEESEMKPPAEPEPGPEIQSMHTKGTELNQENSC